MYASDTDMQLQHSMQHDNTRGASEYNDTYLLRVIDYKSNREVMVLFGREFHREEGGIR